MNKTPRHLQHSHDPESIRKRLQEMKQQSYVRDFVYGAIDGIVTTFAIVAGVVGANLSKETIIILGGANILADGFSMAASNYLGSKAEVDEKNMVSEHELREMKNNPLGEKAEIREIFKAKGYSAEILEEMVENISRNEKEWLKLMLQEEYGLSLEMRSPIKSALMTFASFFVFGMIPLMPYLISNDSPFLFAVLMTGISFFIVGSMKSKWTTESFYVSGIKTTLIGACAAALAYFAGGLLKGI